MLKERNCGWKLKEWHIVSWDVTRVDVREKRTLGAWCSNWPKWFRARKPHYALTCATVSALASSYLLILNCVMNQLYIFFSTNKKIGLICINSPWPPQLHILKNWIEILKKIKNKNKKKGKEKRKEKKAWL